MYPPPISALFPPTSTVAPASTASLTSRSTISTFTRISELCVSTCHSIITCPGMVIAPQSTIHRPFPDAPCRRPDALFTTSFLNLSKIDLVGGWGRKGMNTKRNGTGGYRNVHSSFVKNTPLYIDSFSCKTVLPIVDENSCCEGSYEKLSAYLFVSTIPRIASSTA